jgi:GTPase
VVAVSQKIKGNTKGLSPSELTQVQRIFTRRVEADHLVTRDFAREVATVAQNLGRRIGALISREGRVDEVFIGSRELLYLPDLGRYRLGNARLRRLRLVFSDLSKDSDVASIPPDIMADLEKLRLDAVIAVRDEGSRVPISFAYLVPPSTSDTEQIVVPSSRTETLTDIGDLSLDFAQFIRDLEAELSRYYSQTNFHGRQGAVLVAVGDGSRSDLEDSLDELSELARTAGVEVAETIIQKRKPDPKSVVGSGKLEEIILRCLRLGAELLIFDTELRPAQWRYITNSTELKVLDRSMVILDIFAQRAQSSEGRLQVELAQLKYNMPRLVEKDAGLSRLTGGIGGRGPGETKLEIGRRRLRDRIVELEKRIHALSSQRELKRRRRIENRVPIISIVGYTNAGKSTLFNKLTKSSVLAEDKLFATLDPYQRKAFLPIAGDHKIGGREVIFSDTVGFIRDLPEELFNAFRATLEELQDANLLLHVVDASDGRWKQKVSAVERILENMEIKEIPLVTVFNKSDLISPEEQLLFADYPNSITLSAHSGQGLTRLRQIIASRLGLE